MFDAVTLWKYGGIVGTLILSGFGLPVPEEIPIVTAGAMVGNDARELAEYRRLDNASDEFAELADPAGGRPLSWPAGPCGWRWLPWSILLVASGAAGACRESWCWNICTLRWLTTGPS